MSDIKSTLSKGKDRMQASIEHLQAELAKVRAGKASPAILEGLRVDYYGTPTPVNQVATVSVADARTLTVQPYERNMIGPIERSIKDSNLGLSPQNDGILIRLVLPVLTEERRKQLFKQAKEAGEEAKVAIRNIRREVNDQLKKLQKDGEPEDAVKAAEAETQKTTDSFIAKVDTLLDAKEKDIMTV